MKGNHGDKAWRWPGAVREGESRRESWGVSGGTSPEAEGAVAGSGRSHTFISLAKKYPNF